MFEKNKDCLKKKLKLLSQSINCVYGMRTSTRSLQILVSKTIVDMAKQSEKVPSFFQPLE